MSRRKSTGQLSVKKNIKKVYATKTRKEINEYNKLNDMVNMILTLKGETIKHIETIKSPLNSRISNAGYVDIVDALRDVTDIDGESHINTEVCTSPLLEEVLSNIDDNFFKDKEVVRTTMRPVIYSKLIIQILLSKGFSYKEIEKGITQYGESDVHILNPTELTNHLIECCR